MFIIRVPLFHVIHTLLVTVVYNDLFSVIFVGIDMDEFRYNRKDYGLFPMHPEFIFKIWDFGGQEDFYATHQCFLSTLALYLLVWNLEEGKVLNNCI